MPQEYFASTDKTSRSKYNSLNLMSSSINTRHLYQSYPFNVTNSHFYVPDDNYLKNEAALSPWSQLKNANIMTSKYLLR